MCTMDMSRMYSSIMCDKKIKKNAFYNENYVKMERIYTNYLIKEKLLQGTEEITRASKSFWKYMGKVC